MNDRTDLHAKLGDRHKDAKVATLFAIVLSVVLSNACRRAEEGHVQASYDEGTGRLSRLSVNTSHDGKPNIVSQMHGSKFISIEIDTDEDGRNDRWEYYDDAQVLQRVGFSRSNNGVPDAWAYPAADGTVARIEISTRGDGTANRTEFYDKAVLVRASEDTDADGRADKWETYEAGALVTVAFDTTSSGTPTTTIDYRKEQHTQGVRDVITSPVR